METTLRKHHFVSQVTDYDATPAEPYDVHIGSGSPYEEQLPKGKECDVLVTQGWGRIAYNIVRSLGKKGLSVALGTDEFLGMGVFSRFTSKTFRHPCFVTQTQSFVSDVKESLLRYSPKVYIPSDQEVLAIAKCRDQFDDVNTEIPISSFETLKQLHKKDELSRLAATVGIPIPETIVPTNHQQIIDFAEEYGDPIVIKRLSSSGARGVFYVNRAELSEDPECPTQNIRFGEYLVQRYVKGVGYGVSMLFNKGKLRAKFTHKRLREKSHTGGISTLRMSVANPRLEDYAESILRHVRFHGVAMVEFKYDEDRNQAWLIEINPRFWGSLALAIQSGVDFPYLLYRQATEGDIAPVLDYRKNVTVRWLMGDTAARIRELVRRGRLSALAGSLLKADGYDDFYWDDPLPFVGEVLLSALKYRKTRKMSAEETDLGVDTL
jgi:predicted ATP-grasp superfamily ATP-dependent carboligase